jgi:GxxExxY protein
MEKVYPHQDLTERIIGAAIEVHKALGPGLLESAYQTCLAHEFALRGLTLSRKSRCRLSTKAFDWTAAIALILQWMAKSLSS